MRIAKIVQSIDTPSSQTTAKGKKQRLQTELSLKICFLEGRDL